MVSAVTAASGTAVGVAVALTVADLIVDATHAGTLQAGSLSASATVPTSTNHFGASATSGSGGGDTGIAGSVAILVVTVDVDARVLGTTTLAGALASTASSTSETTTEALPDGPGAGGADLGIGASFALSIINDTVRAGIGDGAVVTGAGAVTIDADQSHVSTTTARTGAKGTTSVAPAIAIVISNLTVSASIGTGAATTVGSVGRVGRPGRPAPPQWPPGTPRAARAQPSGLPSLWPSATTRRRRPPDVN